MIKIFLVCFVALLSNVYAADHNTFKNCSRVPFCSNLRARSDEVKYTVDPSSVAINTETKGVDLTLVANDDTGNLTLTIFGLENHTFRLKIKEQDSKRYELKDVLNGDPKIIPLSLTVNLEYQWAGIRGDGGGDTLYDTIYIGFSPFYIVFGLNITSFYPTVVLDDAGLIFDSTLDQSFAFKLVFQYTTQLYGIHEHADTLALKNTVDGLDPYRLRNLDVAGYELYSPMALYGAVPVLYGHGPNFTSGVFLHNAAEHWYDINGTSAYVMVESGSLDLFIMLGNTPKEVVRQYVGLTGTAHLPQLWALGYHQCRWNYISQEDVKDVVANFNSHNFPLDVIWLDIEYTNGKRYFTWDSTNFGDPDEMQKNISATHKRLVTIIDPHIKVDLEYDVYKRAFEKDLFVKNADGTNFEGDCWPGLSSYIDLLNPVGRYFYGSYYHYENFPHSTPVLSGIWNDMNEPSVFDDSLEKTMPGDAVHYGGVKHRDIHNIYGLLHTMATHQGLIERDFGAKRPFVLTRSHFAGSQRYAAIWTGDNTADWGFLSISYAECLNANLLGIVFCGADVGGFFNNPDVELLQRWYQAGAWLPFYRAHANMGTERREPYLFDDDVQNVIRSAIELRYKHFPVWYTLFYEHTRNGDPIIRPLFYQYADDTQVYDISDHLLVGSDILVRAVAEPGAQSVQVYFPGGSTENWLSVYNNTEVYEGNGFVDIAVDIQSIPVYYRRGSIIVRKDTVRLSSDEMSNDEHTLYVNVDASNAATGTVYLDDSTSFNYLNNKEYSYIKIDAVGSNITLTQVDEDSIYDNFAFVIGQVIVNEVDQLPQNGKPGTYKTKVYRKDVHGNVLSSLKFDFRESVTVELN